MKNTELRPNISGLHRKEKHGLKVCFQQNLNLQYAESEVPLIIYNPGSHLSDNEHKHRKRMFTHVILAQQNRKHVRMRTNDNRTVCACFMDFHTGETSKKRISTSTSKKKENVSFSCAYSCSYFMHVHIGIFQRLCLCLFLYLCLCLC